MQDTKVEALYNDIIEYSWDDHIDDYVKLIHEKGKKYAFEENDLNTIVDKVLKKILSNLKSTIPVDMYENIIFNLGSYRDQDSLDFTIGLIQSYYRDDFIINGNEYSVFDIMFSIYNQYKTKDTLPLEKTLHYMLADLLRIHYSLFLKKHN